MPAPSQRGSKLLGLLLALVMLFAIFWPAAAIAWTIIHGVFEGLAPKEAPPPTGAGSALETLPPLSLTPSLPLLAQTLAWAFGIAILATIIAWPAAWVIRRRGWGVIGLICVPLLLPTYLAYTAYGILRSPGWFIGNWLEHLAQGGWTNAPILAGRVIAALGLSLWAWPIAAVVLGASVKRLDSGILDALRLERLSALRRRWEILYLCRAGVLGAVGAIALIMIGSAVPLHLAQVPHLRHQGLAGPHARARLVAGLGRGVAAAGDRADRGLGHRAPPAPHRRSPRGLGLNVLSHS